MTQANSAWNAAEEGRRGDEALSAARHLLQGGFANDAISRAYYAAFHWARALLVSKGIEPKTHRGVIQLLGLHFVKNGRLSYKVSAMLAHLETYRELSDYTSASQFTEEQAQAEVARAAQFVAKCRALLKGPKRPGKRP